MRFVDEAKMIAKAGDGGAGIVAWRREKFVPLGGPAGGNGGKGGDIIFVANEGMSSLLDLKQQTLISAQDGYKGQTKGKAGHKGRDRLIHVPVGTEIRSTDDQGREFQVDLTSHGQQSIVCRGGDGGFGNTHFKSQNVSAPSKATPGFKGQEKKLTLTLKLMADVGLLGFPNAGKSTLLSRMSNAAPKVASYPFTTIKPMVGVCELDVARTMVVADIPGLIEGASSGQGLGFRFLKHLERVKVLCHLIDCADESSIEERYRVINKELLIYSNELAGLPQVVALTKMDSMSESNNSKRLEFIDGLRSKGIKVHEISSITGYGLKELIEDLYSTSLASSKNVFVEKTSGFDPTKNLY